MRFELAVVWRKDSQIRIRVQFDVVDLKSDGGSDADFEDDFDLAFKHFQVLLIFLVKHVGILGG
jgi:hypothetical protein